MGQTLTNGIFLPNEGERNCYTGLAENWRAIDGYIGSYNVHVADAVIHVSQADRDKWDAVDNKADASALTAHTGNTTIHVTAEDKAAWNGKADASALTAHTGNTTIHVTAADKTTWNTVTSKADASALTAHTGDTTIHVTAADKTNWNGKANDNNVMHLSGNELAGGFKTFDRYININGGYVGNEFSNNARSNLLLRANRDTAGKSGAYITRFRSNKAQGAMSLSDSQMLGVDFLENEVRTNNVLLIQGSGWVNDVPTALKIVSGISNNSFGSTSNPCKINNLNPGALSMPDLTAGVDISAYITDLTGASNINKFTPTADGWISIGLSSADFIELYIPSALMGGCFAKSSINNYSQAFMPVIANKEVRITLKGSSIGWAKFYPCQGNI